MIALLAALLAQDLWDRAKETHSTVERGQAQFRYGPLVDRGGGKVSPGKIAFDLGTDVDFACGRFDLKTSFKSLLNKDVAGDLLGAALGQLRDELAGSAMVLACQMSPTLCDALKHFRVTANDLLALKFAECRAIEEKAEGPAKTLRARALMQCLAEKQATGVPLDEALAACRAADEVRGFDGRRGREIDLVKQVGETFGLKRDARDILDDLLDTTRLSAAGVRGDVKLRAVDAAYERGRTVYEERLRKALDGGSIEGLAPGSVPALRPSDIDLLRVLDEPARRDAIAAMAAAYALVDSSALVHQVQSLLDSAASMADDPTLREQLRLQSARLGGELARLREASEVSARAMQTLAAVHAAAVDDRAVKLRAGTAGWRYAKANALEAGQAVPWGRYCEEPLCPKEKK